MLVFIVSCLLDDSLPACVLIVIFTFQLFFSFTFLSFSPFVSTYLLASFTSLEMIPFSSPDCLTLLFCLPASMLDFSFLPYSFCSFYLFSLFSFPFPVFQVCLLDSINTLFLLFFYTYASLLILIPLLYC